MSEILRVVVALLVVLGVGNLYFLFSSIRTYRSVLPPSPLLFALAGVGVVVGLVGLFIAWVAGRTLLNLPPLPLNGIGVGIGILLLEALPAFIWWQLRRFSSEQDANGAKDDS
jgi:hypothetical protein